MRGQVSLQQQQPLRLQAAACDLDFIANRNHKISAQQAHNVESTLINVNSVLIQRYVPYGLFPSNRKVGSMICKKKPSEHLIWVSTVCLLNGLDI